MAGDSLAHDIEGALSAGRSAVVLRRAGERRANVAAELTIITTLIGR